MFQNFRRTINPASKLVTISRKNQQQIFKRSCCKKTLDEPKRNDNQCMRKLTEFNITGKSFNSGNECGKTVFNTNKPKTEHCKLNTVCSDLRSDNCNRVEQEISNSRDVCMSSERIDCESGRKPAFEDHKDVFKRTMTCRQVINCCPDKTSSSKKANAGQNLNITKNRCNRSKNDKSKTLNNCNMNSTKSCKSVVCPEKSNLGQNCKQNNSKYLCSASDACRILEAKHQQIKNERRCSKNINRCSDNDDSSDQYYQKCDINFEDNEPSKAFGMVTFPPQKKGCLQKIYEFFQR